MRENTPAPYLAGFCDDGSVLRIVPVVKKKIERVFADAKEKHGMRYTRDRGLTHMTN